MRGRPSRSPIDASCRICHAAGPGRENLSDGSTYHTQCYAELLEKRGGLTAQIAACENELGSLPKTMLDFSSVLKWLASLFSEANLEGLQGKVAELRREQEAVAASLFEIHTYWLDYPPDWAERRQAVLDRYGFCHHCGAARSLHVHHRLPLSAGGDHSHSNLVCLCERCHEQAHGGKQIGGGKAHQRKIAFGERIDVLRRAMENDGAVAFGYLNREGRKSTRSIRPRNFMRVGSNLCVVGFCYLRRSERTFAVRRMRGVRAVTKPKPGRYLA